MNQSWNFSGSRRAKITVHTASEIDDVFGEIVSRQFHMIVVFN